jgi:hypothetical protein
LKKEALFLTLAISFIGYNTFVNMFENSGWVLLQRQGSRPIL